MHLEDVTLVRHDIGGMVVYAYLRAYGDLRAEQDESQVRSRLLGG